MDVRACYCFVMLGALLVLGGCGGEQPAPVVPAAGPSTPTPPAEVKPPELPPLQMVLTSGLPETNEIPDLDGGRLTGAVPAEWVLARSPDTILQCRRRADSDYPILMISAKDDAAQGTIQKENVQAFAKTIAAELAADSTLAETRLSEPVTPVKIGDFYGVEYGHGAKTSKHRLHRYLLVTVVDGRRYTVELRALEGTQSGYLAAAQAMAGNLKFKPAAD